MYTAPDPEHRTSVMMPGPQAYAYAGGRPLVNIDPEGRKIYGFTDKASLRRLPRYGAIIRHMDDDDGIAIYVRSVASSDADVMQFKGACTVNWRKESSGGSWCDGDGDRDAVDIKYNVALTQQGYNDRASAWGVSLQATPLYIVAHELGHVYYQQYRMGGSNDPTLGAAYAIDFENDARAPGPQRPMGTE
jgi:hypothetical protein